MTLASWCGNVMGDMESRSLQALLTAGESPKEEPMNRFTAEYPSTPADASFSESCSELSISPHLAFEAFLTLCPLSRHAGSLELFTVRLLSLPRTGGS